MGVPVPVIFVCSARDNMLLTYGQRALVKRVHAFLEDMDPCAPAVLAVVAGKECGVNKLGPGLTTSLLHACALFTDRGFVFIEQGRRYCELARKNLLVQLADMPDVTLEVANKTDVVYHIPDAPGPTRWQFAPVSTLESSMRSLTCSYSGRLCFIYDSPQPSIKEALDDLNPALIPLLKCDANIRVIVACTVRGTVREQAREVAAAQDLDADGHALAVFSFPSFSQEMPHEMPPWENAGLHTKMTQLLDLDTAERVLRESADHMRKVKDNLRESTGIAMPGVHKKE
jgi:hypothetical protein